MNNKITIGVIGAGIMGTGITYVMAEAGFKVILNNQSEYSLDKARTKIETLLLRKMNDDEVKVILDNIECTLDKKLLRTADIIIECIVEDMAIKKQLFGELGKICSKDIILASNTSSLSITELSSVVPNPERVIGIHFSIHLKK